MKIYRVSIESHAEGHQGYNYHPSRKEAQKDLRKSEAAGHDNSGIEEITLTPTKAGIIAALNRFGGHADNG